MLRQQFLDNISYQFTVNPAVALLGPRQCGKTTLARAYVESMQPGPVHYFDLENPSDLNRLEDPMLVLPSLTGLVVIDEIQLRPDLFPVLRVLIDQSQRKTHFLILGSASRELIRQSSESLAGRISYIELTPFSSTEVGNEKQLWLRGGFPLSFLADTDEQAFSWLHHYVRTFLEQDIPNLGIKVGAATLRRFWMMLTHVHGNILNQAELSRAMGASHTAIRHYLDILSGTFMIRLLQPWHANITKRQVKLPKIYFRDSGILHSLLGLQSADSLNHYPNLGSSWEGFVIEEIIRAMQVDAQSCFFWATHNGAELDLLIIKGNKKYGFEIKYSSTPKITKSMRSAIEDLALDRLLVIYPGDHTFPLSQDNVIAIGLNQFLKNPQEFCNSSIN